MHTFAAPPWVWVLAVTFVCGAAVWKGGSDERIAGASVFVAWVATVAAASVQIGKSGWGVGIVDTVLIGILVAIALRSKRLWTIFAAGFHLLAVVVHAARLVDSRAGAWAYATAGVIFGYLLLGALAMGTYNVWRERRQLVMARTPAADPGATLR